MSEVWPISMPCSSGSSKTEGLDHYAVAMNDPEGNEFDVNRRRVQP